MVHFIRWCSVCIYKKFTIEFTKIFSPNSALPGWVHGRTYRTVPVLGKLRQVGEGPVDSEDCWRVRACQHLVLQSCRTVDRAMDAGSGQPEQLPLTEAQCREDWLGAVLLHPLEVGSVGRRHTAMVGDVLAQGVVPVHVYCLPVSLGGMVRGRESW